jgi:hypothetical protein
LLRPACVSAERLSGEVEEGEVHVRGTLVWRAVARFFLRAFGTTASYGGGVGGSRAVGSHCWRRG